MAVGRAKHGAGVPRGKVLESVRGLRAIYAEGLALLRLHARPAARSLTKLAFVEREAARKGVNRDYLWKSMLLADPATGMDREEFDLLCQWVKDYGRVVGRAWVSKLLSVPQKGRMAFAKRVLEQGLSLGEIDTELTRRFGRRREGGRHPRMLTNKRAAMVGLDQKCVSWGRLCDLLNEPSRAGSARRVRLADLPDDVQSRIGSVDRAVRRLRKVVERHLFPSQR